MHNFLSLLKIELITNFKINKRLKKGLISLIGLALLFAVVFGFVGYNYAEMFKDTLTLFGKGDELITLITAYSMLISFALSVYSVSGVLYGFKDYDMLSAMPIKRREIVLSKLIYAYVFDMLLSLCVLVGCLIYVKSSLELSVIIKAIIVTVISPLFPLALSVILGGLISLFSSLFRKKNIVQIIFYVLFIVGYIMLSTLNVGDNIDPTAQIKKILFIYPVLNGAINGTILDLILFALICIGAFSVVSVLVCYTYSFMHNALNTKRGVKNFQLKQYEQKSQLKTLLTKERRRLLSSPIYTMNTCLGPILAVVMFIVFAIMFSSSGFLSAIIGALFIYAPVLLLFNFLLAPTTACSISMEGKNFWIIQTMPIDYKKYFGAKLLLNYIINIPSAIICSIICVVSLKIEITLAILFVIFGVITALFGGVVGLFINILLPKLEWENENQPVKQSASVFVSIIIAFLLVGLYIGMLELFTLTILQAFIIYLSFISVLTAALYIVIFTKGKDILSKRIK